MLATVLALACTGASPATAARAAPGAPAGTVSPAPGAPAGTVSPAPGAPAGSVSPAPGAPSAPGAPAAAAPLPLPDTCEASALVPWQGGWLVGDNEDDAELHTYAPDFTPRAPLALPRPVADLEALALDARGWLAVGSHSTNKAGRPRPERQRVVRADGTGFTVRFEACAPCMAEVGVAPDAGGLNVEGAVVRDGELWLGLRGPLAEDGGALLLALDATGAVRRVVSVPLDGNGVRDLAPGPDGGLLVVAGPVADADAPHMLWALASPEAAPVRLLELPPSTEGIALDPADPRRVVFVTDGDGEPGEPCRAPARWGSVRLPG